MSSDRRVKWEIIFILDYSRETCLVFEINFCTQNITFDCR